jgi:HK97 family phage portal protein
MGFLSRISSVSAPMRLKADYSNYTTAFFAGDDMANSWVTSLSAAGVNVTPDLAMTLSAMYCGVTTIAYDLATLPLLTYKYRDDGGKDRIRGRAADYMRGGIADLAYMLQWAPNDFQTATEFFAGQVAQFLLRSKAYAEIVDGPNGFLAQLLPRHPDRVFTERLPNGNLRYKLIEANGQPRYITQQEMHVVRDLATDPVSSLSRIAYGASAIGTALAAERAAGKFFKSGMTASVVATYKGDMEDEDEIALHKSITRYAAGVENNFGLLLIPDDVTIGNLGIEPEKAQMMLSREWSVYEVARQLRISPRKLMARDKSEGYASAYQDAIDHVVGCIRPLAHTFEQAMQRDLILEKDTYFVKFDLRELMRGDPAQMGEFIEKAVKNRTMRPSEIRTLMLDLNPDEKLDQLSENDNQPGKPASSAPPAQPALQPKSGARATLKGMLALHDNAIRCLRRERVAVEKLAKKHASDVDGWKAALRSFYADHATFVAQTMRLDPRIAMGYAAQHGSALEAQGIAIITGETGEAWERCEADELAALSLEGDFCAA